MQTFLPYASFTATAKCLDRARLGKQRIEAWQIIDALERPTGANRHWAMHPAVAVWRGHTHCLAAYGAMICDEWRRRGYVDTMLPRFEALLCGRSEHLPDWLGDPAFHASHRSNLLRKAPHHYGRFRWTESPDLPYIWPTPKGFGPGAQRAETLIHNGDHS